MARYKYTDMSQGLMLTVNLGEQLLPGTFEWTLNYLFDRMDLSSFDTNYKNDNLGAAAYSPKILLKAIMFSYSRGIISSRKIESACMENMVLKALAEDSEPDHSTIAAFISDNSEAVKELFAQVLLQCSELGLITGEMYSIDRCKLPSNASKEWSGKLDELKNKREKLEKYMARVLLQHQTLDKDESAKKIQAPFKKTMGDDGERRKKSIERLEKKLQKLDLFLKQAEPKKGVSGEEVKTNVTDPESAFIKSSHGYIQGYNGIAIADSGNQVIITAEAIGSGAEGGCFPEMLDNLEENMKMVSGQKKPLENALVTGDTGYFSEENLQEAAKRKIQVLIPDPQFRKRDPHFAEKKKEKGGKETKYTKDDFSYDKKKNIYICPAGKELAHSGKMTLRNNSGEQYRAKSVDCAQCPLQDKCITRKPSKGGKSSSPARTLYIADQKYKENLSDKMRDKIDDPAYRELYSRRMQIIEPTFSNITYCKGMSKFTLRTKEKVNIQWKLYCIVHNIGKCMNVLAKKLIA
jgi:transposase